MSTSGGWSHFVQSLFPKMLIDGEWHQPLFFYESLINWCGLIIIYFGFEFIPKQKAGTIGLSYFLWYGIVRLCLESLRDNKYTFANTYIMSGLFVGIAAVLIVLNLCISKYWRRVFLFKTIFTIKNHFRTYNDLFYYLGR
jgi:phosphatidylglycerol:prolipoprotein diacylglycerol transferase